MNYATDYARTANPDTHEPRRGTIGRDLAYLLVAAIAMIALVGAALAAIGG